MHYPEILEHYVCGQERLRQIFTAYSADTRKPDESDDNYKERLAEFKRVQRDEKIRKKFEDWLRVDIPIGIDQKLRNADAIRAVDLAWDSPPIQKFSVPLMMYACGKVKLEDVHQTLLSKCGPKIANELIKQETLPNDPNRSYLTVNAPRISEVSIDLMHSYVTRRHAAMDALWSNQWPLYRYNPRGQTPTALLRADGLTQRVDIISQAYNYRHSDSQYRRDMLLYGQSVIFPRSSWDVKSGIRPKRGVDGKPDFKNPEPYVYKEGVDFVNPHPLRIGEDSSEPLANINTGNGPNWIFHWDLQRWGCINSDAENTPYYNLKKVFTSSRFTDLAGKYNSFFQQYFDPTVLVYPQMRSDPSAENERNLQIGRYGTKDSDKGVLLTNYFRRINPKMVGIGDYDCDVWIRLVVAGDCTVIFAEVMPMGPACYGAINWNDGRSANQSMGMALLGYQDQASNIVSHMIQQLRASLVQLWLIDKDSLDPAVREELKKKGADKDYWVDPKIWEYSAVKLKELGINDPRAAFAIIQNQMTNVIQNGLLALGELLKLCDRLLNLSPNELGQPIQRESSAREVQEIASTTQSIYSFINQGPREQISAKKELIYGSLVTRASQTVRVPVMNKYTYATIKAAGFDVEDSTSDYKDDDVVEIESPITGGLHNLIYDYHFDSRDGSERPVNTQGAQIMMQLLQTLLGIPAIAQKLGLKGMFDWLNVIIRMSGAPTDFQFTTTDGEDEDLNTSDQPAPVAPAQPAPPVSAPAPTVEPASISAAPNSDVMEQRLSRVEQMMQQIIQLAQNRTAA